MKALMTVFIVTFSICGCRKLEPGHGKVRRVWLYSVAVSNTIPIIRDTIFPGQEGYPNNAWLMLEAFKTHETGGIWTFFQDDELIQILNYDESGYTVIPDGTGGGHERYTDKKYNHMLNWHWANGGTNYSPEYPIEENLLEGYRIRNYFKREQ